MATVLRDDRRELAALMGCRTFFELQEALNYEYTAYREHLLEKRLQGHRVWTLPCGVMVQNAICGLAYDQLFWRHGYHRDRTASTWNLYVQLPADILKTLKRRLNARRRRDYVKADTIRSSLAPYVIIEDLVAGE